MLTTLKIVGVILMMVLAVKLLPDSPVEEKIVETLVIDAIEAVL